MSTAALAQDDFAEVAEDRRLHYFRTWLKDFDKDVSTKVDRFAHFRAWLDQLSDVEITRSYQRHYNPTYLNLLSVFGEELSNDTVHSLAIKCIKSKLWSECEYYFHLSKLLELVKSRQNGKTFETDESLLRLKGWDTSLIGSLLQRGKGLVICSFRFGAIRYIPIEIALLGFSTLEAVNGPTHEVMQSAFDSLGPSENIPRSTEESSPQPENIRLLKAVNAEDSRCTVQLVDALKRGEIIGLCIEGNTGSDGPWGDTSKSTIDFLGHSISAKNGAARLAAALGAPILPVVALRDDDGSGQLLFSDPIIRPSGLKRSANEEFVQATMQSLYTLLEHYVRRYPEQWEGWSALHRWRLHEAEAAATNQVLTNTSPQEIAALLREGRKFRLNQRRVAQLPTKDGLMWVDLKTLKGFQNPKWAGRENILATLSEPQGLDLNWINKGSADPGWEEKICLLLAYLQQSGLIASN
jgi:Bacterial lipid A biosynthesis acyltransferase